VPAFLSSLVVFIHRIIEIEWAVKNDKAFKPSPKRAKKAKGKKQKKAEVEAEMGMEVDGVGEALPLSNDKLGEYPMSDDQMEVDEVEHSLMGLVAFGTELTNTGSKRSLAALNGADYEGTETPAKRPKKSGKKVVVVESDDEDEFVPAAAPRKSKRKIGAIV
jgi:kinesin family protein 22